jgi:drug/metabolite transporter (DMT)-like permease
MTFLILTIVFSVSIVITFRLFSRYNIDNLQAITTNYLVAAILGFMVHPEAYTFSELPARPWFIFSCIIGVTFILTFFLFALSAQKVGVAVTSVTSKMSVVIPVSVGIMAYAEPLNTIKFTGIMVSLLAFYLTFRKKNNQKIDKRFIILPILLFLGNGANDTLTKHSQMFYIGDEFLLFLGMVFTVGFFIGTTLIIIKAIRNKDPRGMVQRKNLIAGTWLGVLNFGSSYFFIVGLSLFESSVFFPIFNVSIVSLSALAGFFFFKERLKPINWIGILLAVCAILLIAFGS